MTHDTVSQLLLKVTPPLMPVVRSMPCLMQAILANSGQTTIRVNQRMALGYRDHVAREIFADLQDIERLQPAEFRIVDYDREFSPATDYVYLEPDQEISRSFDLFAFYVPANPGQYRLILHYQADEELAHAPADVVRGITSSKPILLTVE